MFESLELNILCMGQLTAGKSTFLQFYTQSEHSEQHYKIFTHRQNTLKNLPIIYLHQIEQKIGVDAYLNSQYNGILFFVRIDGFHNTGKNVVELLSLYSQISGSNIYKIPIKIVVISSKRGKNYDDIAPCQKRKLEQEVRNIFDHTQIIYLSSNRENYQAKLAQFYHQIINNEAAGIKESMYSNWRTRSIFHFFFPDQLKLYLIKIYQQMKFTLNHKIRTLSAINTKIK